ncbi:ERF family protein [Lacticaseibacillus mingshuiensis]|uniref:ERF family protein n=1 Tax=Lacticaseibacillus mingshuiensis TaxID=2799574 RepID=UPI0019527309|nr:ERF family protein [Lacticaseibacillus mingshuiensis]
MKRSESTIELIKDMRKFREQVKQPDKNAMNPFTKSKYSDLSAVIKSVDAGIKGTGLSWTQDVCNSEQGVTVQTIIFHDSGEYIEFSPLTMPAGKGTAQELGSAETYARRYTLQTAFGLVGDADDDGNAASNRTQETQQRPTRTTQPRSTPRREEHRPPQQAAPAERMAGNDDKQKLLDRIKAFSKEQHRDANEVYTAVVNRANVGAVKLGTLTLEQLVALSAAFQDMVTTAPDPETAGAGEDGEVPPLPF